jgi:hypothetical protein
MQIVRKDCAFFFETQYIYYCVQNSLPLASGLTKKSSVCTKSPNILNAPFIVIIHGSLVCPFRFIIWIVVYLSVYEEATTLSYICTMSVDVISQ